MCPFRQDNEQVYVLLYTQQPSLFEVKLRRVVLSELDALIIVYRVTIF